MPYQLIRTTPEDVERSGPEVRRVRDAAVQAAYVLHDNAGVAKAEAQQFSATLAKAAIGETVEHWSGYSFRIKRV